MIKLTAEQKKAEKYERRQGPDLLCRAFSILAVLGWLLFIAGMVVAHYASPELDTGLVRYWDIDIRSVWHPRLTAYLQYLLWAAAIVSAISLVLNRARLRRRGDHLHFNIVMLLLGSIGLLLYLYLQV
ncbi:hypothetical protein ORJ00_11610 [Rheinheimera baltica]|uniref:hypothetical protein n=1 Tax=Rheinheimera baltica TaxID=67576 RepID=UPI0027401DE6|nr:hypothetical protein [Rheinheimera baltica]MDP5143392.1 hypothetical protein [Rheinheimera baltica]MDP5151230.1 hypothetical protein [Rheinheimera baltica]